MIEIRPVRKEEHEVVEEIRAANYPPDESFRAWILGNPSGCCFVGFVGGNLAGYVISFPYVMGKPYPIGEVRMPSDFSDCLYLHDLCVAGWARGCGLGGALAEVVLRRPGPVALTAVMGSEGFWSELGFRPIFGLDYCGGPATYMLRP